MDICKMEYEVRTSIDSNQGWGVFFILDSYGHICAKTNDKEEAELIKNALNYYDEKILRW